MLCNFFDKFSFRIKSLFTVQYSGENHFFLISILQTSGAIRGDSAKRINHFEISTLSKIHGTELCQK